MEKQTIRFKDCVIYYDRYLSPNKPFVVMLHSFASSRQIFSEQIRVLKRQYQILAIDLPSHGESEHSKYVHIKDMPEVLNVIFETEKITEAHFIAISEGAEVAQAFAHLFPKKMTSLIGISTFSIYHNSYKTVASTQFLAKLKLNFLRLFSFKSYKKWFSKRSAHSNEGQQRFIKSTEGLKRSSQRALKGMKRFYSLGENKNQYPTYLVCGEDDLEVIKDSSFQFEQKTPLTTLEGYKNAKQIVFLDNGRLFNERIKVFLNAMDNQGDR